MLFTNTKKKKRKKKKEEKKENSIAYLSRNRQWPTSILGLHKKPVRFL